MPFAAPVDAPEQHLGLALPGELRELVDGRDQDGGQPPIDLLVDHHHRQPLAARLPLRERALAQAISAIRERAAGAAGERFDAHVATVVRDKDNVAPKAGTAYTFWVRVLRLGDPLMLTRPQVFGVSDREVFNL